MALTLSENLGVAAFVMGVVALALIAAVLGLVIQHPCSGCSASNGGGSGPHYGGPLPDLAGVGLRAPPAVAAPAAAAAAPAGAAAAPAVAVKPPVAAALASNGVERLTREQVQAMKDGPGVMAVWAVTNTCGPCIRLMSVLDDMWAKGQLAGLPVAGVVLRDQWPTDMVPQYTPTLYKVGKGVYAEAGTGAGSPDAIRDKLKTLV